jgi:hypothetical protein
MDGHEDRWWVLDNGMLPTEGEFPFGDHTISLVDEEAGGIVAYFNSLELANEYVAEKNKKQEICASVKFVAADVQSVNDELSDEEAEEFLENNYKRIQDRLCELGHSIIEDLM